MSYALRNTIILLVTLFLFAGAGYSYITFFQKAEIEELTEIRSEKQSDYNQKKATSDSYQAIQTAYNRANDYITNYNKALYPTSSTDDVFDFLNSLSEGNSNVFFGYVFADSTIEDQYGIINSTFTGYGNYSNLVRFINKIENSQLINKIVTLTLSPFGEEELSNVNFSFNLESYYSRIQIDELEPDFTDIRLDSSVSDYNIFYPLVLGNLPANEDNLLVVENSRMVGLTPTRIFVIDQQGNLRNLQVGDEVYLGTLESINYNEKTATFNLNKGGITEIVTLEIER